MSEVTVGVRDLKSRLSEYLSRVKQGQTIVITEHGRPVGRILPIEKSLDERIMILMDAGLVAWNGKRLELIDPPVVNRSGQQVSDLLVEMRE